MGTYLLHDEQVWTVNGMEEQPEMETGDEEPNIIEKIMDTIFSECDCDGTGIVAVSKLIHFMMSQADPNLDRSALGDLKLLLDPQGCDTEVTRQTFILAMTSWVQTVSNNNYEDKDSPCEDKDSSHESTDSARISDDEQISAPASPTQNCKLDIPCKTSVAKFRLSTGHDCLAKHLLRLGILHSPKCILCGQPSAEMDEQHLEVYTAFEDFLNSSNVSSYSCGGNDVRSSPIRNEINSLVEQVSELKQSNKWLEDKNKNLQSQLHSSEDINLQLQSEIENINRELSSLRVAVAEFQERQKEHEELREREVSMETTIKSLNSKVQLLEKESQILRQQLEQLENEKSELKLELEEKRENQEMQRIITVQETELEKIMKICNYLESENDQKSSHILELETSIDDFRISYNHMLEEKHSLEDRLLNMEDELLSAQSHSPFCVCKSSCTTLDVSKDDSFVSARSSPDSFLIESPSSLQAEIEAVKEEELQSFSPYGQATTSLALIENSIDTRHIQKFQEMEEEKERQNLRIEFLQQQLQETLREVDILRKKEEQQEQEHTNTKSDPARLQNDTDNRTFSEVFDKEVQCLLSYELEHKESQTTQISSSSCSADVEKRFQSSTTQTDAEFSAFTEGEPHRKKKRTASRSSVTKETPDSTSGILTSEEQNLSFSEPELWKWVRETDALLDERRMLLEKNPVVKGSGDNRNGVQRNFRQRILSSVGSRNHVKWRRRRASITAFPSLNSPDSSTSSSTSFIFPERNHAHRIEHGCQTSSTNLESLTPGWDRTDRLDRPEVAEGSINDIKFLADVCYVETQGSALEENNLVDTVNLKSSLSNSCPEFRSENIDSTCSDSDKNSPCSNNSTWNNTKDAPCTSHSSTRNLKRRHSYSPADIAFQTRAAQMDSVVPLTMDYVVIQTRRWATFLLLFAALWSLLSTFVPIAAQSKSCIPFSWVSWEELLRPYIKIRRNGPPPM
ncbi:227 kDa spindle- and centromere-associated protein-like isoform X2 [Periplaneta americana]|uniref:227 kDa spindle- and centromere-associated protein-like isoform X2 n=2 Tax=Periplaneta americana TaxID=6978 RepID=UPI0037E78714